MIALTMRGNKKRFAHFIGFSWTSADMFRRSGGAMHDRPAHEGQCKALRSLHWLFMDIGGHVPPLRRGDA